MHEFSEMMTGLFISLCALMFVLDGGGQATARVQWVLPTQPTVDYLTTVPEPLPAPALADLDGDGDDELVLVSHLARDAPPMLQVFALPTLDLFSESTTQEALVSKGAAAVSSNPKLEAALGVSRRRGFFG